ncbi:Ig-like domain-containing protein [Clostridium sp. DL1XJH146]
MNRKKKISIVLIIIISVLLPLGGCGYEESVENITVDFNGSKTVEMKVNAPRISQGKLGVVKYDSVKGVLIYTPNENVYGKDTFSYSKGGGCSRGVKGTINVNIKEPQAIEVVDDSLICVEDNLVEIGSILDNDTTEVIGPLEFAGFSDFENGKVEKQDDSYFFIPDENFYGEAGFTYKVEDALGRMAFGYAYVKVTSAPDAPIAVDDVVQGYNDKTIVIDVLKNDSDIDGDDIDLIQISHYGSNDSLGSMEIKNDKLYYTPFEGKIGIDKYKYTIKDNSSDGLQATGFVSVGLIARGSNIDKTISTNEDEGTSFSVQGDNIRINKYSTNGDISIDGNKIIYTPKKDFHGDDFFTLFFKNDNNGTGYMEVKVKVNSINDAPTAIDDEYTLVDADTETEYKLDVLSNDLDIDGDILTIISVDEGGNGEISIKDNKLVYKPTTKSGTDTFSYKISDGKGGSSIATVNLSIIPPKPKAVDDRYEINQNANTLTCDVLVNDSYSQLKSINILDVKVGTVAVKDNKVLYYSPKDFSGQDEITYTISDDFGRTSSEATVFITIIPPNNAPTAKDDAFTVDEDSENNVLDVLANDTDIDGDTLSIHSVFLSGDGTVEKETDPVTGAETGKLIYNPGENFNGQQSIIYQVSDGKTSSMARAIVTVKPVNDAPIAMNDAFTVEEDSEHNVFDVLVNDTDIDGDTLSIDSAFTSADGTVEKETDSVTGAETGKLIYNPAENFHGEEIITYTISDGNGGTSTGNITVTVNSVNDAPIAVDDAFTVEEDSVDNVFAVLINDTDVDGDTLAIDSVTTSEDGTVEKEIDSVTGVETGKLIYKPAANYIDIEIITYTISDGNGGTSTANVTITINSVNDDPIAMNDAFTVEEDSENNVLAVLVNDTDIDGDTLSIDSASTSADGTVEKEIDSVTGAETGKLIYKPAANFHGEETITYTISDGNGGTSTVNITVTVNSVNDAPIAVDDAFTVEEDSVDNVFAVLINDTDVDGDTLAIDSVTTSEDGTVEKEIDSVTGAETGKLIYNPAENFHGEEIITYTISDGNGGTSTGNITVTVNSVNDAPIAVDDAFTVEEDSENNVFDVLANDIDVDGDTLSIVSVSLIGDGTVEKEIDPVTGVETGKLIYSPLEYLEEEETITYTISDGNGGTSTAIVTVIAIYIEDPR